MKSHPKNNWKTMFNQEFSDFNACHRMLPNLQLTDSDDRTKEISYLKVTNQHLWDQLKGDSWPETPVDYLNNRESLPAVIQNEIGGLLEAKVKVTEDQYLFLKKNLTNYHSTSLQLTKLVDDGFLVTNIPLKLQSLKEKKMIVENFDQCIDWYNEWVEKSGFGEKFNHEQVLALDHQEDERLNSPLVISDTNLVAVNKS